MSRRKNQRPAPSDAGKGPEKRDAANRARAAPPASPAPAPRAPGANKLVVWLFALLIVIAGIAAYAGSLDGVFLLDDKPRILNATHIRELWPPWTAMARTSRPLVELSLALNYALGGVTTRGYHVFNLAVHLVAGLTLFGIVRRMLEGERLRERYGRVAPWLAGVIALLWTVHPLQTESVSYVIQRAESMMGLFFLLTLYCTQRGASARRPAPWYVAAVLACWLGMASKEVMVVAPLVTLLYDRIFLSDSFAGIVNKRGALYAGFAAGWLMLAALVLTAPIDEPQVLVDNLTPWRYLVTQPEVIAHYLRLAFWPKPLILDYLWPLTDSIASALPAAILLVVLLAATVFALSRRHWAGFWGAWFFLVLAPTSSVLPLADVAFEHRMYLPLAAVIVLVVVGAYRGLVLLGTRLAAPSAMAGGVGLALATVATVAFALTTAHRNDDYRSEIAMWRDTVANRPQNPRAQYTLGNVLDRAGKLDEAMARYDVAMRLKPDYVDPHVNLGAALLARNKVDEAIAQFTEAVRLKPTSTEARNNLGVAYLRQGKVDDAITHLSEGVRLKPDSADARYKLGVALATRGRYEEAVAQYAAALRIDPNHADAKTWQKAAQANLQRTRDAQGKP